MTADEARADPSYPELVKAYARALAPNHVHGADAPERFAVQRLVTGESVLSVFRDGLLYEDEKPPVPCGPPPSPKLAEVLDRALLQSLGVPDEVIKEDMKPENFSNHAQQRSLFS